MDRYIEKILTARVYDVAIETPLQRAKLLSGKLQNQVLLKREDMQPVFSFKCRGAYNKIYQLQQQSKTADTGLHTELGGVICSSAGNHAQGVALAARELGLHAVVVMPQTTPQIKVNAVQALGAEAVLVGDAYDDAAQYAMQRSQKDGLVSTK